jgi:hypothetical protein
LINSEKFHNLTILQDEKFAILDTKLQQSVKTLLETLIDIHNKLHSEMRKADAEAAKQASDKARRLDDVVNNSLIHSLRFPAMRNRHEEINEAHQRTFSWIFQPPQEHTRPWDDFPNWLRNDTDIYWINGKAGSGKSTLMRYIFDSPKTSEHLKSWAGYAELDVAGFFFWNSGSIEQRSQSGTQINFNGARSTLIFISYSFAPFHISLFVIISKNYFVEQSPSIQ